MRSVSALVTVVLAIVPAAPAAQTQTALDARVQAPQLEPPRRGSLVGQLASVHFGPADVARGAFVLPSPFAAPEDRGALRTAIFPSYAADNPISEWGMGWQASLTMSRSRLAGDLDYATDDLTSPFGRLVRGSDGYWYPLGLSRPVRVSWSGDLITAWLDDGTVMTFGGPARTTTPRGTYAWALTSVQTPTGRKTRLEWSANPSGRLFLDRVWYGGVGDDSQYRIDLAYELLVQPFEDHRAGRLLSLDRRVKTVTVLARHALRGTFEERWHYDLAYLQDGFGPGFYLQTVQQVFRGGEAPPATRYAYALASRGLASATLVANPALDDVLAVLGPDLTSPARSIVIDAELDGLSDLEAALDQTLVRRTATGFSLEALPPPPPYSYERCRPPPGPYNAPRTLARLRSGAGDETPYVVDLEFHPMSGTTTFTACDREGRWLGGQELPDDWALSATVKLVDVNRDHLPDVVRLDPGSYTVLPNASTASGFAFGAARQGWLSPSFAADAAWVHDLNGDGLPDLVGRYPDGLVVWFGTGNLEFTPEGRTLQFWPLAGGALPLSQYALTFVDANKDGMTDAVLTSAAGATAMLFMNRGDSFHEVFVPGLAYVDAQTTPPAVADLTGSGNTELAYVRGGAAYALALDAPETGLMESADDGRGTVVLFAWGRARPAPGLRQRPAVVEAITVQSSGYDAVTYAFQHETPRLHGVGKFLLGFDRVVRTGPLGADAADFLNEDRYAGVLLGSSTRDVLAPGLEKFDSRVYQEAVFQGVPWKRLQAETVGWRSTAPTGPAPKAETTSHLAWDRELCPSLSRRASEAGTLTIEKRFVVPAAFGPALACLADRVVETGAHPQPSLDFRHETAISRNAVGLVDRLESVAGAERWTLQTLGYTPEWQIRTVASPGRGASTFSWAPGTRLLDAVTLPDGSTVEALDRDAVTDGVQQLRTTHGALSYDQHFRFDGQERLQKQWDDLGAATEANPNLLVRSYRYAAATTPGSIYASTLVDAIAGSARDAVDLATAAGEPVSSATRIPEGWTFGSLVSRSRVRGETKRQARATMPGSTDPRALDYSALATGASQVERSVAGPLDAAGDVSTRFHADVERHVVERLDLGADGRLVKTVRENGTWRRVESLDAGRRALDLWDEVDAHYGYTYDVAGRLRRVTLPNGDAHLATYDDHGRLASVERKGVATVEYAYDGGTGLLAQKRFLEHAPATPTIVHLSDLPRASEIATYSNAVKDRSIAGNPLTLAGVVYAKGLGAHAHSEIAYDLAGRGARWFVADVGIDDEVASDSCGSVTFEVWADGVRLWDSGLMRATTPTKTVELDLAGRSRLTLKVTKADGYDYCDHGDWGGARLTGVAPATRTTWLSDERGTETVWGWSRARMDRSVGGNPIALDGIVHAKGIGAHAPSELVYDLEGRGCTLLQAEVGIDDEVSSDSCGSVTFEVWADGSKLFDSGLMRASTPRRSLSVDLVGRRQVKLEVTQADATDYCDHGDWASARLTCALGARRTVAYVYDAIGRVAEERHASPAGVKSHVYYYDGASPAAPAARTTPGFLTAVAGDGYRKTFEYWPDGKPKTTSVTIGSWRTVETRFTYVESREVKSRTTRLLDGVGVELSSTQEVLEYDTYGRVSSSTRGAAPFASFAYDGNGLAKSATFPAGASVSLARDDLTRRVKGSTSAASSGTLSTVQRMNARGLVDFETFAAGAASRKRTYAYSDQRFLAGASDAAASYGYGFDLSGLPSSITDARGTRSLTQSGDVLVSGGVTYTFDALGRTVSRAGPAPGPGDLALAYGPDGQVASASGGGRTWTFIYDEAGQRLAKLSGGVVVAAYPDAGYLDASGLAERVAFGGRTVGLWKNGSFQPVATDLLGSVIGEGGALNVASPFGWRSVRPSTSAAIDYVEKGFDADLGLVRMGVRDYDPELNRFTTPDPLFLERVEGCRSSPVDCNLYSYVANDPTARTDSTGLYGGIDDAIASGAGVVIGVAAQGVADLISGKLSSWQDYTAAAVGGAVMGEVTLYFGPVAGSAAGSAAANLTRQGLNRATGKQESFSAGSLVVETGVGALAGKAGAVATERLVRPLSRAVKGEIGEWASYAYNKLKGAQWVGEQVERAGGTRTTADLEFAKDGVSYFVESKFGTSTLTKPQREARRVLGDAAYRVERWGYDWVRRVGGNLGFGGGETAVRATTEERTR